MSVLCIFITFIQAGGAATLGTLMVTVVEEETDVERWHWLSVLPSGGGAAVISCKASHIPLLGTTGSEV